MKVAGKLLFLITWKEIRWNSIPCKTRETTLNNKNSVLFCLSVYIHSRKKNITFTIHKRRIWGSLIPFLDWNLVLSPNQCSISQRYSSSLGGRREKKNTFCWFLIDKSIDYIPPVIGLIDHRRKKTTTALVICWIRILRLLVTLINWFIWSNICFLFTVYYVL